MPKCTQEDDKSPYCGICGFSLSFDGRRFVLYLASGLFVACVCCIPIILVPLSVTSLVKHRVPACRWLRKWNPFNHFYPRLLIFLISHTPSVAHSDAVLEFGMMCCWDSKSPNPSNSIQSYHHTEHFFEAHSHSELIMFELPCTNDMDSLRVPP